MGQTAAVAGHARFDLGPRSLGHADGLAAIGRDSPDRERVFAHRREVNEVPTWRPDRIGIGFVLGRQARDLSAVRRYGPQVAKVRKADCPTVGRPRRCDVIPQAIPPIGQDRDLRGIVERCDGNPSVAVLVCHGERYSPAVRRDGGVGGTGQHQYGWATESRDLPDAAFPGSIGNEDQTAAVRRPRRRAIGCRIRSQSQLLASGRVHQPDVRIARAIGDECQFTAVGREGRFGLAGRLARQSRRCPRRQRALSCPPPTAGHRGDEQRSRHHAPHGQASRDGPSQVQQILRMFDADRPELPQLGPQTLGGLVAVIGLLSQTVRDDPVDLRRHRRIGVADACRLLAQDR